MRRILLVPSELVGALVLVLGIAGCGHRPSSRTYVAPRAAGAQDLDAAMQSQAAAQAPGTTPVGTVLRGVAERKGSRTDFHLQLDEGQCYWFSAVGGGDIETLGLYLWGSSFFRVASSLGRGPETMLMHCPEKTGMFRLQAKARRGAGPFVVGVFTKAAPPRPPEPVEDLEGLIDAEATATAPGAERVGAFFAGESEKGQWYSKLRAGNCYWWIARGEKSVKEISLFLFDPSRSRREHNKSPSRAVTIGHCPTRSGMYRLELKVRAGSGNYKVGLYRKTHRGDPADPAPAAAPAPVAPPSAS